MHKTLHKTLHKTMYKTPKHAHIARYKPIGGGCEQ